MNINDFNELFIKNFNYYKEKVLPYIFILETKEGYIKIIPRKNNLKHLLGISHSANCFFGSLNASDFYNYVDVNGINCFKNEWIIEEEYLIDEFKKYDRQVIVEKNKCFIDVFESMITSNELYVFTPGVNSSNIPDYICVCYDGFYIESFLDIKAKDNSDVFFFSSIIGNPINPNQYKGKKILVTKLYKIRKNNTDFCYDNFKFIKKERKITNSRENALASSTKKIIKIDFRKETKYINKNLKNGFSISVGKYKKNSIQVLKNGIEICKDLRETTTINSAKDVIDYINLNLQ